ncbi:hypothetical protein DID73_02195 [Candidatus Marinamargulisbacteria bacterium SCGC AG-343-K17]|nr:hypothetical protein DID73_02195 [Candidatus Marinamargulisbacteria bacterium SCGC AG-343-K17]
MSQIDDLNPEFETTFLSEPKTRRNALKSIASGMTVATLSGCVNIRKPAQTIKAYNKEPERLIPGIPNYYASSLEINGDVNGVLVTSHEGRPTKIDGNPRHPNNYGKSNGFIQAEIHQLYDPDRIQHHLIKNKHASFKHIKDALRGINKNGSLAIVLPKTTSLINQHLLAKIKSKYPGVNIYFIDPINTDNQYQSIKDATGAYGYYDYNFSKAKVIVNFNHDFLGNEASRISHLKEYVNAQSSFQRVSFTDSLTVSDSKADAVINSSLKEQEHTIMYIAKILAKKYGASYFTDSYRKLNYDKTLVNLKKAKEIISLLVKYRSKSIVSVGETHTKRTHDIVLLINSILKNINRTIKIHSISAKQTSFLRRQTFTSCIQDLENKLSSGSLKTILSVDVDLTRFINRSTNLFKGLDIFYATSYKNNFSELSSYVISKTHFLEDWGVLVSKEGHISIQQPLIRPLYDGKSLTDILLVLLNEKRDTYAYLRRFLQQKKISFNSLKRYGVIPRKRKKPSLSVDFITFDKLTTLNDNLTLSIIPSGRLLDGRYSNNSWLQETPDSISKLTWGNAFQISHNYAKEHGLITGDVVRISVDNKKVLKGPVIILPGQNDQTITVTYGYGKVFDATFSNYGIATRGLSPNQSYVISNVQKLNETEVLADTQMNHGLDEEPLAAGGIKNRIQNILQIKTMDELNHPHHASHHIHSLFKELKYEGKYQWGMSIDLNSCLGCSACSIACQAENNIPVVGKKEVQRGREMSWIRIDRYYIENDAHETTINFMPVACVHCENAPCEQVCPVNATVHDDEGLNVMTYNRCIGTRYCANNCPYKVRRFNFFDWHQKNAQSVKKDRIHLFDYFREPAKQTQQQFNPDVTIRMRGVMEKCTYCLQRISHAKIQSKNNNDETPIKTLETACQQACATDSIVFGDIEDSTSLVSKKRKSKRRYDLLQNELNTKPRTIYLAKIKKPVWHSVKKETSNGHH